MLTLLFLALVAINPFKPFQVEEKAQVLFFLSSECPISRFYAREIQNICKEYRSRGVQCGLVFEDFPVNEAALRAHLDEFGYREIPYTTDGAGKIAKRANAIVTPEAIVIDRVGKIRYRGRIDDYYAALGKTRRAATVHDLRDALEAVVAGRAVAQPETTPFGCFIETSELIRNH